MTTEQIEKMTDLLLMKRTNNLKQLLDIKHRLQHVTTINGIEYINDAKSTSILSTAYALQCMEKDVVWIVDSHALHQDYNDLIDCVQEKVKKIMAIGHQAEIILSTFPNVEGRAYSSLDEVLKDNESLQMGEIVLYSPACPTDDRYENYKLRGNDFMNQVKKIATN